MRVPGQRRQPDTSNPRVDILTAATVTRRIRVGPFVSDEGRIKLEGTPLNRSPRRAAAQLQMLVRLFAERDAMAQILRIDFSGVDQQTVYVFCGQVLANPPARLTISRGESAPSFGNNHLVLTRPGLVLTMTRGIVTRAPGSLKLKADGTLKVG